MNPPSEPTGEDCAFGPELPAHLQGELPLERSAMLEQHLLSCPSCQAERASLVALLEALGEEPTPADDGVPHEKIVQTAFATSFARPLIGRGLAMLAGLGLVVAWITWLQNDQPEREDPEPPARVQEAADLIEAAGAARGWLIGQQREDGLWDARFSARRTEVTALVLLAVLGEGALADGGLLACVERAAPRLALEPDDVAPVPGADADALARALPLAREALARMRSGELEAATSVASAAHRDLVRALATEIWGWPEGAPLDSAPELARLRERVLRARGREGSYRPASAGPHAGERVLATASALLLLECRIAGAPRPAAR